MGAERDPHDSNPYAAQTSQNRQAPWVGGGTPVDVDLDGLREYAKHMLDQQMDLASRTSHLTHLHDMPYEAWDGQVLGEAAFVRQQLAGNASELSTYLTYLGRTLFNIGCAAQTVADIYNSADGTSAAELSDVMFAFGDKSVPRPDGLPPGIGQTYSEALMAEDPSVATPATSAEWRAPEETVVSPYQTSQVSEGPNGQTREIVTTNVPGSGMTVVTTTVYGRDGTVLSTSSTRTTSTFTGNVQTTQVESSAGGRPSGSSTTTTTYAGGDVTSRQTENFGPDGKPTGSRTETTNRETGEQTETTTSVDENGKPHVTDRVVVGRETEGQRAVPDPIAAEYDPTMQRVN